MCILAVVCFLILRGAYLGLNELGYQHYTVVHKSNFKQWCVDTGEIVECHTNRIEGAWKHCKEHFRRMISINTKLRTTFGGDCMEESCLQ